MYKVLKIISNIISKCHQYSTINFIFVNSNNNTIIIIIDNKYRKYFLF